MSCIGYIYVIYRMHIHGMSSTYILHMVYILYTLNMPHLVYIYIYMQCIWYTYISCMFYKLCNTCYIYDKTIHDIYITHRRYMYAMYGNLYCMMYICNMLYM